MFNEVKNIFIIGIKGVGMTNLALILKKMRKSVSGSDIKEEFITDELLKKNNISIQTDFNPEALPSEVELVIYSAAHLGANNPQVQEAIRRGVKTAHQAQILGELNDSFKTNIAVCGSHGKTTTTAFLAHALLKLNQNPSYFIGSPSFKSDSKTLPGGDFRGNEYFVFEADEYAVDPPDDKITKLNFLNPDIILCTNIDFDHPDVFQNLEQVKQIFSDFFKKSKLSILCEGNSEIKVKNIKVNQQGTTFSLFYKSEDFGSFNISLYGEKNALNAAGVIVTLAELKFDLEQIRKAVLGFSGTKRRFEVKAEINDTYLFDDYAHHPQEIKATIAAARQRFPGRRIIVIFQPHTYSRTKVLLDQFTQALNLADSALIAPIFPSARENLNDFKVTAHDLVKGNLKNLFAYDSTKELLNNLENLIRAKDVVFTMGAGDIYKLDRDIIKIIKRLQIHE